jgi:hypothetical protein
MAKEKSPVLELHPGRARKNSRFSISNSDRGNRGMNNTTYGATRKILESHGYAPVAMDRTFGFMSADEPAAIATVPGYASEAGGLADYDKRHVIAVAITARDTKARAAILTVLAKHGVGNGPVRVASDGAEYHVIKWDGYDVPHATTDKLPGEYDPAAAVISQVYDGKGKIQPALIRVDHGTWKNGSPLTVPRSKLPALDKAKLAALFEEIKDVVRQHLPVAEYRVPLSPEAVRAKAERERLEAELAKRTDAEIWQLVEQHARVVAASGAAQWDKARNASLVATAQWKIEAYDSIVAERQEAAEVEARRKRRAHA